MKKNIIYITIALVLLILLVSGYKIFLGSKNLNYSIILDKKKESGYTQITVFQAGEEKKLDVPDSLKIETAPAYNIKTKKNKVVSIDPVKYYSGKINSIDGSNVNLENKSLKTTENTKYYKLDGKSISEITDKSLIVGYQGYRFIMDKNDNIKTVLCSIPKVDRIRTLISNSDFTSVNHKEIKFLFNSETELKSKDLNYKFVPNDELLVSYTGNAMSLSLIKGGSTTNIGSTSNKIELIQGTSTKISISSNTRSNGYVPSYYGSFEISKNQNGIKLINEAYINDYLKGVVSSEMPTSGGLEGYKIQAIVSRTAAYYDILSKEYSKLGVHAVDYSLSQKYEASPSSSQSDEGVESTSGEIVTKDGEVIDAKYYSTSPGFGASYEDIFGKVTPTKDYLTTLSFNETGTKVNRKNEDDLSQYLKDWTVKAYDSNSPLFRWKYSIDYSALSKILNENIHSIFTEKSKDFKQKWILFIYKSADIPKDGIGKIKDIYVSDRTSSGNVSEVTIVSELNTYKVRGTDNLKKLLVPKENFELTTVYGKPIDNLTKLPSSFFTIEKNMSGDKFKSITIYGGGEGHGVGLSKYGSIGLSRKNKTAQEVVKTFYPGTEIVNIDREFRLEVENRKS